MPPKYDATINSKSLAGASPRAGTMSPQRKELPDRYIQTLKEILDYYKKTEDRLKQVKIDVENTEKETITLREKHLGIANNKLDELDEEFSARSTPHLLGNSSQLEHSELNRSLPEQRKLMASNLADTININAERAASFIENSLLIQQAAVLLTRKIWLYAKKLSNNRWGGISLEGFNHKAWEDYLCRATDSNALQAEDCPKLLDAIPPPLPNEIETQLASIRFNSEQAIKVRRICHTLIRAKTPCQELITNTRPYSEAEDIAIQVKHVADKLQTDVYRWINTKRFKETMGDISDILTLTANMLDNTTNSDTTTTTGDTVTSELIVKIITQKIIVKIGTYIEEVGHLPSQSDTNTASWVKPIVDAITSGSTELPEKISVYIESMTHPLLNMKPALKKEQANHIQNFLTAFLQAFQTPNFNDLSMTDSLFFARLDKAIEDRSKKFRHSMEGIVKEISTPVQAYLIQQRAQQLRTNVTTSLDRDVTKNIDLLLKKIIDDERISANDAEQLRGFQRTTRWFTANECERIIAVNHFDASLYNGNRLPEGITDLGTKRQQLADALASYVEDRSENNLQAIINNLDDTTKGKHTEAEVSLKQKNEQLIAAQKKFDNAENLIKDAKEMVRRIKLLLVNAILQYITRSSFGVFRLHGTSGLTIACNALRELITAHDPMAILTASQGLFIQLGTLDTYNQGSLAAYIDHSTTPDSSKTETDITNNVFYHKASFNTVKSKVDKKFEYHFFKANQSNIWPEQIDNLNSSSSAVNETNCVTQTLRNFKDDIINNVQLTDQLQLRLQNDSLIHHTKHNHTKETTRSEAFGNKFSLFRTSESKDMKSRIIAMSSQLTEQISKLSDPGT